MKSLFILRASAAKNQKYAESGIMEVLKIISTEYFHEDHLEGIINPKFQLSIISSWRDTADF